MRARIGRPPTGRSALWVVSVRGARRRATPATRMIAVMAWRSGAELLLTRLHLLHQLGERRRLDDLVELRAVVRHEAHALDDHVVHEPPVALAQHPILDRHLAALLGDELALHGGLVALD